jgi:hypothetical protein
MNTSGDLPSNDSKSNSDNSQPDAVAVTDFASLQGDESPSTGAEKKDAALEALGESLTAEQRAQREERFIWIVIVVILVDVIWFRNSPNATFPIAILILELVALMVIARRLKIDVYVALVERILHGMSRSGGG